MWGKKNIFKDKRYHYSYFLFIVVVVETRHALSPQGAFIPIAPCLSISY
jgi:hypothetical protein